MRRSLAMLPLLLASIDCGGTAAPPVHTATVAAQAAPLAANANAPASAPQQAAALAPSPSRLPAPARLVAIGDLHGDFEATRGVLRLAGAIDEQDRWVGEALVVVQTGDQLDRGDGERKILDLLERLAAEAQAAGGALHVLNGNHELMNAAGDLRYVTAGGFVDFADFAPASGVALDDPRVSRTPPAMRGRLLAFAPGGPYARKLATRPVILIVGDSVFAHAGVLPEHVRQGIDAINAETQRWLRGEGEISPNIVESDESPVWTRRFCQDPGPADCAVAAATLSQLGVKRMVVAHTVHTEGITQNCEGTVWCIDVGMSAYYGGHLEALEIVGERVTPLRP